MLTFGYPYVIIITESEGSAMPEIMKRIYNSMETGKFYTLNELATIHATLERKIVKVNVALLLYQGVIEKIIDLEIKQEFYRKPIDK
jgi:hypothetical protein